MFLICHAHILVQELYTFVIVFVCFGKSLIEAFSLIFLSPGEH